MNINLEKLSVKAANNIFNFIGQLNEDLIYGNHLANIPPAYWDLADEVGGIDYGACEDLWDALKSIEYDISRGMCENILPRFEEIFYIAKNSYIAWDSFENRFYDELVDDI